MTPSARCILWLVVTMVGCAANPIEPRASAGTLVDASHEGTYDTWDVLAATGDDSSIVIAASGPGGATGATRFLAEDDGSLTIIVEAEGVSTQLDLDPDGTIAGEAHAPAADALLAEMITDLDGRQAELVALAANGPASEDGAAREALSFGVDFGCMWETMVFIVQGGSEPGCVFVPVTSPRLQLDVLTPGGRVLQANWSWLGDPFHPEFLEIAPGESGQQILTGRMPRGALGHSSYVTLWYVVDDREHISHLTFAHSWRLERHEVIELSDLCGGYSCVEHVCVHTSAPRLLCTEDLH